VTAINTRSVQFTSSTLKLEGELYLPDVERAPGVVVCHPHTLYGGDMHNNVVAAACDALASAGSVALRFNFRGAGNSEGEYDRGLGEREDLIAALDYLHEQPEVDRESIGVAGYSFGAMVAAEVASDALSGLVLISPPVAMSDLRVQWGCPALLMAGDQDDIAPEDRVRLAASNSHAEVQIVEGADHSWWGFERELGDAVAAFFGRRAG
jgi:alpha/beta superfamily hydrolase